MVVATAEHDMQNPGAFFASVEAGIVLKGFNTPEVTRGSVYISNDSKNRKFSPRALGAGFSGPMKTVVTSEVVGEERKKKRLLFEL